MSEDRVFVFGSFRFVPRQQLLLRDGCPVKVGCRALDILYLLVKNAGEAVSHGALQQFVWPDTFVDASNVKVHIHSLRRALGENSARGSYIVSVPGRGYRFVASVAIEAVAPASLVHEVVPAAHSLPAQRSLIGREDEVDRVVALLAQRNLVTLVGPGGVGKTSVGIAVAHRVERNYPDGVFFVDFATASKSAVVPSVLAAACGIRGNPPDTVLALVEYLAGRRVLIVMDSCEHVLASVALIAMRFQEASLSACLLATSLEPLRLSTEAVQLVEPLSFPAPASVRALADALKYSGVELFAVRALEWADSQLTDDDLPAVVTLCEKLGGLPLAIELAAAKLDQYSPAALLESLDRRFSLLRNQDPGAHFRHRTLWATLDWSYQLLSVGEATIFRVLSVFSAPFAQEDVATMAQVVSYNPYQTTVALGGLVAKSLVAAELDGDIPRYRLLDCARVYAAEKLGQDACAHATYRHFARFMLTLLERFAQERAWMVENNVSTAPNLTQYKRRLSDLRDALSWCFGAGDDPVMGIRLTVSAIPLWSELSLMAEEEFQVERALKHSAAPGCDDTHRAALALSRAWSGTQDRRLLPENDAGWRVALQLADRTNDVHLRLRALMGWSSYLVIAGRYREALQALGDYRQVAASYAGGVSVMDGDRLHTMTDVYLGKLVLAREKLERHSHALAHGEARSKVPRYQVEPYAQVQMLLALVTWLMGSPDQAAALVEEAVENTGRVNHTVAQSYVLAAGALPIALWNGDRACVQRYVDRLGANLETECMAIWVPMHRFLRPAGLHAGGQVDATDEMRTEIDRMLSSGFQMNVTLYLGLLAEALLQNGEPDDADRTVEEALSLSERSGEVWCLPDLLRIKAKVLAARAQQERAEQLFHEAMSKATAMAARSLELRVAADLAALWIEQGREARAVALLGAIYEGFSEGHGTRDLLRASALLEAARRSVPND